MPHPEKRDLDLTARRLRDWISARLPGAQDLHVSDLRAPSDTGFSSETLLFALDYRAEGEARHEELVVRLEPRGLNVFPSYDMGLQFRVMKVLGETDVPVPRMRWLEEDEAALGVPFYVMDRVEGIVPTDNPPYHSGGWISELPPEQREALWWNGLGAMTRVHKVDWRGLGFEALLDQPERGDTPLEQQLHYYDEYFSWGMDRARHPRIQAGLDYLHANRPAEPPVGLCWGDSRLANQIFHDGRCVAVIDWEMVHLGSPVEDLAWWIMADRCFSEGLGVERSAGFPDRDATVARWQELTGWEARDLDYYEVLALLRFSINMARVGMQMKHYGILPEDHEMDRDNLGSLTLSRKLDEVAR